MTALDVSDRSFAAGAVVTGDYLPWARATAASFAAHNPGVRFAVLIADGPASEASLRTDEPFDLLVAGDLGIEPRELAWMRLIYTGLELCCALKPWLLRTLLDDADAALYLDSDLFVCDSLAPTAELAAQAGVLLSPHALAPRVLPNMPDDDDLLVAGQFNAGFLAVGRAGMPFLDWWASRLARECTAWDPAVPRRYLDQRWLDLVVNYFPFAVDRDPGVNVARWNLPQRRLEHSGDRFTVDGEPLRVFHFSGFDPSRPAALSPSSSSPHPAADVSRAPALAALVDRYVETLLEAGWVPRSHSGAVASRAPEQYAGLPLTQPVRSAIRAALVASEQAGVVPAGGPDEGAALLDWLRAPAGPDGLSWFLSGLWSSHAGVRAAFPAVPGADAKRYIGWSTREGISLGLVPAEIAGAATPLGLEAAVGLVVLLDVDELLDDPALIGGVADEFPTAAELTFVLRAPGWEAQALLSVLGPLLAGHGLDGPGSPDVLAVLEPAAPAAIAAVAGAMLTRREPASAFAQLPRAADACELRRLLTHNGASQPTALATAAGAR
jgi:hypothetical protein